MSERKQSAVPPVPGLLACHKEDRRRGALAVMKALPALIASADDPDNCGDLAADFYSWSFNDASRLAESLGTMPEFARGAVMALAEYIHFTGTTGIPELDRWLPVTAMTDKQLRREIDRMQVSLDDEAGGKAGGAQDEQE